MLDINLTTFLSQILVTITWNRKNFEKNVPILEEHCSIECT